MKLNFKVKLSKLQDISKDFGRLSVSLGDEIFLKINLILMMKFL